MGDTPEVELSQVNVQVAEDAAKPADVASPAVVEVEEVAAKPAEVAAQPEPRKSLDLKRPSTEKGRRSLDASRSFDVPRREGDAPSAVNVRQSAMGAIGDRQQKARAAESQPVDDTPKPVQHPHKGKKHHKPPPPSNIVIIPCLKKKQKMSTGDEFQEWHSLSQHDILAKLETSVEKGLTTEEAEVRDRPHVLISVGFASGARMICLRTSVSACRVLGRCREHCANGAVERGHCNGFQPISGCRRAS
jgi:hypothetical protein